MTFCTTSARPPDNSPGHPAAMRREVVLVPPGPDDPATLAMARRGILICRAGQAVARIIEVPFDAPAHASGIGPEELRPGRFVKWDDQAAAYVAEKPGHVLLQRGRLEVNDTLELLEDIDAATGPVQYEGQLVVHRGILDSALVKAAGAITVQGAVEAAEVHAGGDLHVHHGICGKERGAVSAAGRLTARFITNAQARSGGDMLIANEIINSHVICGGALKAENSTILGGHVIALGGIHCHTAGSEAGIKTILEAGLAPERYDDLEKIVAAAEASLQQVRDIRAKVEPLLARAKNLTAAQKEKATELLFSADEADARARKELVAAAQLRNALRTCLGTHIVVASLLCPGVTVRYPIAGGMVMARLRGPVEITLQTHGSDAQVVVIDRYHNSITPLAGVPAAPAATDFIRRLLTGDHQLGGASEGPTAP
jgi:hypothetical protein